ncbi:hypothetical protein BS78_02G332600 [Paspalum vaginatum]|nr:hypothetical protein BS78_02G332600 [Paspalum vaginatum]
MLHRNTSHRDGGAQGEGPPSSPSAAAGRSPSGSRHSGPMTPPSAAAAAREPQQEPPAASKGFIVGL